MLKVEAAADGAGLYQAAPVALTAAKTMTA